MTEAPNAVKMLLAPLEFDLAGKSGIKIEPYTNAEGKNVYVLSWTDYVINEWHETYTTLPQALARVAVLCACLESDNEEDTTLGFKSDQTDFAIQAMRFINEQVA